MEHSSLLQSEQFAELSEALQTEVTELVHWSDRFGWLGLVVGWRTSGWRMFGCVLVHTFKILVM